MFPCKYLTGGKMTSLASQNIGLDGLAVFDTVFANTLDVRVPRFDVPWSSANCGSVNMASVHTWLSGVVGSTGTNVLFGVVPVTVHTPVLVGCMSVNREIVAKVEFITHRYGDSHGIHYAAQIGTKPYRFLWFDKLGAVPESEFALKKGFSQYDDKYTTL